MNINFLACALLNTLNVLANAANNVQAHVHSAFNPLGHVLTNVTSAQENAARTAPAHVLRTVRTFQLDNAKNSNAKLMAVVKNAIKTVPQRTNQRARALINTLYAWPKNAAKNVPKTNARATMCILETVAKNGKIAHQNAVMSVRQTARKSYNHVELVKLQKC